MFSLWFINNLTFNFIGIHRRTLTKRHGPTPLQKLCAQRARLLSLKKDPETRNAKNSGPTLVREKSQMPTRKTKMWKTSIAGDSAVVKGIIPLVALGPQPALLFVLDTMLQRHCCIWQRWKYPYQSLLFLSKIDSNYCFHPISLFEFVFLSKNPLL